MKFHKLIFLSITFCELFEVPLYDALLAEPPTGLRLEGPRGNSRGGFFVFDMLLTANFLLFSPSWSILKDFNFEVKLS